MGPYIDKCVPFQVMSNQLNLLQVDSKSNCRNISRMISGNRMHLSSILNIMAKAVNTYVGYIRLFHFFINLQRFVIIGYCLPNFEENN